MKKVEIDCDHKIKRAVDTILQYGDEILLDKIIKGKSKVQW